MRTTTWIAALVAVVLVGLGVAWLVWPPPPAVIAPPVPEGILPPEQRPTALGELPLASSPGPRCRPAEAPDMLELVASPERRGKRHDRLVVVPRAMLGRDLTGVMLLPATEAGEAGGLMLARADDGSVAAELGFQLLDVVVEAGGRPIRGLDDAREALGRFEASGITCLRVWRGGKYVVRWVVLEPEP